MRTVFNIPVIEEAKGRSRRSSSRARASASKSEWLRCFLIAGAAPHEPAESRPPLER